MNIASTCKRKKNERDSEREREDRMVRYCGRMMNRVQIKEKQKKNARNRAMDED